MSRPGSRRRPCTRDGVSGPDAASDEMPGFPRLGELSVDPGELALDMILDRVSSPLKATPELAALPEMLVGLSGPAEPGELALEAAVLARFRRRVRPAGACGAARAPAQRKAPWRRGLRRPRLAAALVIAAIGLAGTAAAYAGVLPAPLQDLAHRLLDAPSAQHASGHHPGSVPGHQSGVAPAVSPSGWQPARSAAPSPAAGHRTRGTRAEAAKPARSATPRPARQPTGQPGQHNRPGQSFRQSRAPRPSPSPRPTAA